MCSLEPACPSPRSPCSSIFLPETALVNDPVTGQEATGRLKCTRLQGWQKGGDSALQPQTQQDPQRRGHHLPRVLLLKERSLASSLDVAWELGGGDQSDPLGDVQNQNLPCTEGSR